MVVPDGGDRNSPGNPFYNTLPSGLFRRLLTAVGLSDVAGRSVVSGGVLVPSLTRALLEAVAFNHVDCCHLLLASGAPLSPSPPRAAPLLHVAAHHGSVACALLLLDAGAKVDEVTATQAPLPRVLGAPAVVKDAGQCFLPRDEALQGSRCKRRRVQFSRKSWDVM